MTRDVKMSFANDDNTASTVTQLYAVTQAEYINEPERYANKRTFQPEKFSAKCSFCQA